MAKHIWSVLCSKSVVDQDSQQVSLLDVLEALSITLLEPRKRSSDSIQFHTEVVSLWTRSDPAKAEKATCQLELITPAGKAIHTSDLALDLTKARFRSIFRAEAFPVHEEGTYWFRVSLRNAGGNWKTVADLPLAVTIRATTENKEQTKKSAPKAKRSGSRSKHS